MKTDGGMRPELALILAACSALQFINPVFGVTAVVVLAAIAALVVVWDGSGLWVCAKRLEKGRFTWPQSGDAQGKVILSHEELSLLLGGIDLTKTKHKRWYRKVPPEGHADA